MILSLELGYDEFTASNGWLDRFKTRHNTKSSILSGESANVRDEDVQDFMKRINEEGSPQRNDSQIQPSYGKACGSLTMPRQAYWPTIPYSSQLCPSTARASRPYMTKP